MEELIEIGSRVLFRQNSKVMRDFRELQSQRSMKDREKTIDSLERICRRSIEEELWKLTRYPVLETQGEGLYWYTNVLEGKQNFMLGIPVFATTLALMCDDEVRFILINVYQNNNFYIIEPGKGFISQIGGLCRVNNSSTAIGSQIGTDLMNLKSVNKRNVYGNILSCLYTCTGNMDGFVLQMNDIESEIVRVMLEEASGLYSRRGNLSVGSNAIIHQELMDFVVQSSGDEVKAKSDTISFCCGPTNKFPTWSTDIYNEALIADSHCSTNGKARVREVQKLIKDLLQLPKDYKVLMMNGSATGALECAFFNLLGHNNIQNFAFDVFGRRWGGEIESMIENLKKYSKNYPFLTKMNYNVDAVIKGEIPNETKFDPKGDLVLVYTGTSTGHVWDKHLLRQAKSQDRVTIVDATSAAFVEELPWNELDAVAFSFQKILGCEAGLGCLVLSPKAIRLILEREPVFHAPRILRLNELWIRRIAEEGMLVNTISMLNLHEAYCSLRWALESGGLSYMRKQATNNQTLIESKMTNELEFLIPDPAMRSKSLLCLRPTDLSLQTWEFVNRVAWVAEKLGVICIAGHPEEYPCWRFWTGPTMTKVGEGFDRFLQAFKEVKAGL